MTVFLKFLDKKVIAWFVCDIWQKYHLWYLKIIPNITHLTSREIMYNNFEISLVVFMLMLQTMLLPITKLWKTDRSNEGLMLETSPF